MKKHAIILLCCLSSVAFGQLQTKVTTLSLDSIFLDNSGTFVLYNLNNDQFQVYNLERADQKFAVHSTSKIVWSIIGLEEGLVAGESEIVKWDSIKYPPKPWWPKGFKQDQTIVTALNRSVNWYYFELLKEMTPEMIAQYLNKLDYQTGFQVEKVHYFSLTYHIKKSAYEQIEFLKHIYLNEFNLSSNTLELIRKAMLYKKEPGYSIYMKTGTGPVANENAIGWLIGWVEKGKEVYFFAFNVVDEDEGQVGRLRNEYAFRVLRSMAMLN